MKRPLKTISLLTASALFAFNPLAAVETDPVGYVTVDVAPGTGIAKRSTLISIPLVETADIDGAAAGEISQVSSNSFVSTGAGWTAGALSNPSAPFFVEITSGDAEGLMVLVSRSQPNTNDSITISTDDQQVLDLVEVGVQPGDGFKVFPGDTLGSLFGTPEDSGVIGGASASVADTLVLVLNGSASTFYFNTESDRWTRVAFGNPDATNQPLRPHSGIDFQRIGDEPLSFLVSGNVPVNSRATLVRTTGSTLLAQYWPTDTSITDLNLQNLSTWRSGPNANVADKLLVTSGGSINTYFYDGANWRRSAFGNPISDTVVIPAATTVLVQRGGSETSSDLLKQNVPYN